MDSKRVFQTDPLKIIKMIGLAPERTKRIPNKEEVVKLAK